MNLKQQMHQNENNLFWGRSSLGTNYDFQRIKRHLSNCLWLSYNKLMASPHFKYSFSISYNVTVFEWWYLPLCLELSLSCFSHNVFQGGCDCNWSGAGRRSRRRSRRRRRRRKRKRRQRRRRLGEMRPPGRVGTLSLPPLLLAGILRPVDWRTPSLPLRGCPQQCPVLLKLLKPAQCARPALALKTVKEWVCEVCLVSLTG